VELFFITLVIGMATAMLIATVVSAVDRWIPSQLIRVGLTFPTSLLITWLLGYTFPTLAVVALAAGFFSEASLTLLSKAATVTEVVTRRR
jgi:ABC-type dipeptide/oligopeptide/nickel transport system permease subunit